MMAQINIGAEQALATYPSADPSFLGVYLAGIHDVPATVAANNFMSLMNPTGSGKKIVVLGVTVADYSVSTVTGSTSMEVWRVGASSGGTLTTAANVNRFVSTFSNPVAEVRTGNPTVTLTGATALIGFPPTLGGGAQSPNSAATTPGASFILSPGEGVVFVQNVGDVDERWNIQIIWAEK